MPSIYDRLEHLDKQDILDEIKDYITDIASDVSSLDDGLQNKCSDISKFIENLEDKSFREVKEFLEGLADDLHSISKGLY